MTPRLATRCAAAALALAAGLYGCGPNPIKPGYVSSQTAPPLEIPPGLSRPPDNPATDIPPAPAPHPTPVADTALEKPPTVALETDELRLEHDGALYWLVVQESQDQVWQQVLAYWQARGIKLAFENPDLGLMQTDQVAPPAGAPVPRPAGRTPGPGEPRVAFRVRMEHFSDVGNTEIYVTARMRGRINGPDGAVQEVALPPDPALSAWVLHDISLSIGGHAMANIPVPQPRPQPPFATAERRNGVVQALIIDKTLDMAWRQVGAAIDRLGYTLVEDDPGERRMALSTGAPRAVVKQRGFWARLFSPGAPAARAQVPVYRVVFTAPGTGAAPNGRAQDRGEPQASRNGRGPEKAEAEAAPEGGAGAATAPADRVRVTVEPRPDSGARAGEASKILQAIYQQLQYPPPAPAGG